MVRLDRCACAIYLIFVVVASICPDSFFQQVFTKIHVGKILGQCASGGGQSTGFAILQNISEHQPSSLVDIFPRLCNNSIFKQNSLPSRSGIIASVGKVNQVCINNNLYYFLSVASTEIVLRNKCGFTSSCACACARSHPGICSQSIQ